MKYNRVFVIVADSLGVGACSDSCKYGDVGVDTLGHISNEMYKEYGKFNIPNLQRLGMANLHNLKGVEAVKNPLGSYAKLSPISHGKDSLTGHWEMMGIKIDTPFKMFNDNGFPPELIRELEKRLGKKIIGNKLSNGMDIIKQLAHRELENDELIIYTSNDSVMQICGNENTMGLDNLYKYCEIAREVTLRDEWCVARVIARPYIDNGNDRYIRTSNRRDFAISPKTKTYLEGLKSHGYDVISVGKINDIFSGKGITNSNPSKTSAHGMEQTIKIASNNFNGLCFTNLVDFDNIGHYKDTLGYGKELENFDVKLGNLLTVLNHNDLLIITADHGNDPTAINTDHTREEVPMIAYSKKYGRSRGSHLGNFENFGMIGATIADNFDIEHIPTAVGSSLLQFI